jgi:hypothetical protein
MRSDISIDQEVNLAATTPICGRRGQDFTESAASEGRKNGTKTAACQICHRFAASSVFCPRLPG